MTIENTTTEPENQKVVRNERHGGILFVANDIGNFIHHRANLAASALGMGLTPFVIAGGAIPKQELPFKFELIRIERFSLHVRDVALFFNILMRILTLKPRIVHCISIKPYLYGGLAFRIARLVGWKGAMVATIPGLGRLYDATDQHLQARLRRTAVEFFLRIAMRDAVVTFETDQDRQFWISRRLVTSVQTHVMQGAGIDLERFASNANARSSSGAMRVLYAGRLLKSKGLDVFLEVARSHGRTDVEMIVAGFPESDPDAIPLQSLADHEKIQFLGAVEDMPSLLGEVDVVVLPSRYNEGIPRILIEAAACGCVPVATEFAGSKALIRNHDTGFFLSSKHKTEQVKELADLLSELAKDAVLRRSVGDRARAFVEKNHFSVRSVSDMFSMIYKNAPRARLWSR